MERTPEPLGKALEEVPPPEGELAKVAGGTGPRSELDPALGFVLDNFKAAVGLEGSVPTAEEVESWAQGLGNMGVKRDFTPVKRKYHRLTLLTLDGFQARWPQAADLANSSGGFGGGCASTGLSKRRRPLSKGPTGPGGVCGAPNGNRKAGGGSTHLPLPPSPFLPQECFQRVSQHPVGMRL